VSNGNSKHISLHKACDQGLASSLSRILKAEEIKRLLFFFPCFFTMELARSLSFQFHGHGKSHVFALLHVLKRWAHHIYWKENNTFEGQQADTPGLLVLTCACWCRALY